MLTQQHLVQLVQGSTMVEEPTGSGLQLWVGGEAAHGAGDEDQGALFDGELRVVRRRCNRLSQMHIACHRFIIGQWL